MTHYDITIIGGGFFGLYLADYFASLGQKVVIIEKENDAMQRASFNNQARVHNGYHYPRSILTGLRSRISFPKFINEFEECIKSDFEKYYMIAKPLGNVTTHQFKKFCDRISAPYKKAPEKIKNLTNKHMIDEVYQTTEFAFDSVKLKNEMLTRLANRNVEILYSHTAKNVKYNLDSSNIIVQIEHENNQISISSKQVFNCTYALINQILQESKLELIPMRHEMTEMCIVTPPEELNNIGLTVMCGPFFSAMPFPSKHKHSFSHVRYTPHFQWDDLDSTNFEIVSDKNNATRNSAWKKMKLDAQRYIPILSEMKYEESLWEVKTILPSSEIDDSRPILFKENYGIKGFHCILGGKIDNIYEALHTITKLGLDKHG